MARRLLFVEAREVTVMRLILGTVFLGLGAFPLCAAGAPDTRVHPEATIRAGRDASPSLEATPRKDVYVEGATKKIGRLDEQIAQVRRERDGLDAGTTKYRLLDMRVHALEGKLGEARANLKSLERAELWSGYRARLDRNLDELNDIMGRRLAE